MHNYIQRKNLKPNQYTDNKKCNHIHSLYSVYYLTILYLACVKQLHNLFFKCPMTFFFSFFFQIESIIN